VPINLPASRSTAAQPAVGPAESVVADAAAVERDVARILARALVQQFASDALPAEAVEPAAPERAKFSSIDRRRLRARADRCRTRQLDAGNV